MKKEMTFSWWAGRDGEHYIVNEDSREAVIAAYIRDYGDEEGFHIVEASQDAKFSYPSAESIFEIFTGCNEDLSGEDEYFAENVTLTPEHDADLEKSFKEMFSSWMERNGIEPNVYTFTAERNKEFIPGTQQDPDEAREDRDERERLEKENPDDGT